MLNFHFLESLSRRYNEFGKALTPKSKLGKKLSDFLGYFTLKERVIFYTLILIFLISFGLLIKKLDNMVTVEVPMQGGVMREGIVGIPRFSNPVLATSDVDKDLAALVYSGLMRVGPNGNLIPDLAEKYDVSKDALTYTFTLSKDAAFQDGSKVTSADVAYTVNQVRNPIFKSPRFSAWDGVNVETPDASTVIFKLRSPYALFLESTTLGILPKNIWKKTTDDTFPYSELNLSGIGSGPYRVTDIKKNKDGVPTRITLAAFNKFALGKPYIKTLELNFYSSEDSLYSAYKSHAVDAISGISADEEKKLESGGARAVSFYLPRVFAVFFNQNQVPAFTYKEVRTALDVALDKDSITTTVLGKYGTSIDGPLPPGSFGYASSTGVKTDEAARITKAQLLLEQSGWKQVNNIFQKTTIGTNKKKTDIKLSFALATADTPELKQTAELIKDVWTKLGAQVTLKVYEVGDLNQNVIRPRQFDTLFFGEIVGRNPDPYFFWHSSQRADPGLNIAMYTNPSVDKLTDSIRTSTSSSDRLEKLQMLNQTISRDLPASFVYAPRYIYLINKRVKGVAPLALTTPDERFSNIHTWYIDTERVWKLFAK